MIPGCLTLTPSIHLLHKLRETDSLRVWWSLIPRGLGAVQGRLSGLKSGGCHWQRKAHGSNSSESAASSKTANSGHVEPTKQPLSKFLKACCCNQLPVDLEVPDSFFGGRFLNFFLEASILKFISVTSTLGEKKNGHNLVQPCGPQ